MYSIQYASPAPQAQAAARVGFDLIWLGSPRTLRWFATKRVGASFDNYHDARDLHLAVRHIDYTIVDCRAMVRCIEY